MEPTFLQILPLYKIIFEKKTKKSKNVLTEERRFDILNEQLARRDKYPKKFFKKSQKMC